MAAFPVEQVALAHYIRFYFSELLPGTVLIVPLPELAAPHADSGNTLQYSMI